VWVLKKAMVSEKKWKKVLSAKREGSYITYHANHSRFKIDFGHGLPADFP
jgi:hypothetical protein